MNIEQLLDAAMQHGDQAEDDKELGDLQIALRVAYDLLTDDQKKKFFDDPFVQEILSWL
jgi:hypothetical protein